MQYLLSAEEFDKLGPKAETKSMRDAALELSRRLANVSDFICIRNPEPPRGLYCHHCPAEDLCPFDYKKRPK